MVFSDDDATVLIDEVENALKHSAATTRIVRLQVGSTILRPGWFEVGADETPGEALGRFLREVAGSFDGRGGPAVDGDD